MTFDADQCYTHPEPPLHAFLDNVSTFSLWRWYENEDFNTEYFPSWSKCHDKFGDGCTIDFPIRLHNMRHLPTS
ncbi:hypothetical protein EMCRGX_G029278 [Ephydatia muelleri]